MTMAVRGRPAGEKRRRFEWRVIRIPFSAVQFLVTLVVLLILGGVGYYYRAHLPILQGRVPESVKSLLGWIGLGEPGAGGEGGGGQDYLEKRYAEISYASGEVKVQRVRDLNWVSADTKMKLETGDRVRTFSGARAEVKFDDGSTLKIKPDSLIIIGDLVENLRTKVRKTKVMTTVANIEADIKKSPTRESKFQLETPSATAEMEKAKFSAEVGPGKDSTVKVYDGSLTVDTGQKRVQVSELSKVSIGAGREISAVSQIVPAPRIISPRSLSKFLSGDPFKIAFDVRWLPVPKAAGYHVQVDKDRRFGNPLIDRPDVRAAEYKIVGLNAGVYYARVGSVDAPGQEGNFSEPIVFMIAIDTKPPEVNIQKFVSSRAAGGFDISIEGSTEPTAQVRLAGRNLVVDEQGRFSASLRGLSLREREVSLVARDQAGNETLMPLKVTGG